MYIPCRHGVHFIDTTMVGTGPRDCADHGLRPWLQLGSPYGADVPAHSGLAYVAGEIHCGTLWNKHVALLPVYLAEKCLVFVR